MSSISSWPERERPRERLKELGPRSLSDAELLALVIGAGSKGTNAVDAARRILVESGGLDGISDMGLGAIERLPFVGEAKGARIIACLEYRGENSAAAEWTAARMSSKGIDLVWEI
jgi:DNA repair protein RadC